MHILWRARTCFTGWTDRHGGFMHAGRTGLATSNSAHPGFLSTGSSDRSTIAGSPEDWVVLATIFRLILAASAGLFVRAWALSDTAVVAVLSRLVTGGQARRAYRGPAEECAVVTVRSCLKGRPVNRSRLDRLIAAA
jgi:hypothetical protein